MTSPIDVHASFGQSNGWGSGSLAGAPTPAAGSALVYWNNAFPTSVGAICQILEARTFAEATGTWSMWPAFQIERHRLTGRATLMVPASIGSTAMAAGVADVGNGHWGRDGYWFGYGCALVQDAIAKIAAAPYSYAPTLRSIEWCQGEAEAGPISLGTMTKETARDQFADICLHLREVFPAVAINVYRTGSIPSHIGLGDKGFAEVRWAQEEVACLLPFVNIVFRNAVGFPQRGMLNADNIHWNQAGLNEAGTLGARNGLMPSGAA